MCHVVDGLARIEGNTDEVGRQPPPAVPPHVLPDPDPAHPKQSQSCPARLPAALNQTSDFQHPQNDFNNEAGDISSEAESLDFAFSDPEDIDLSKYPLN